MKLMHVMAPDSTCRMPRQGLPHVSHGAPPGTHPQPPPLYPGPPLAASLLFLKPLLQLHNLPPAQPFNHTPRRLAPVSPPQMPLRWPHLKPLSPPLQHLLLQSLARPAFRSHPQQQPDRVRMKERGCRALAVHSPHHWQETCPNQQPQAAPTVLLQADKIGAALLHPQHAQQLRQAHQLMPVSLCCHCL